MKNKKIIMSGFIAFFLVSMVIAINASKPTEQEKNDMLIEQLTKDELIQKSKWNKLEAKKNYNKLVIELRKLETINSNLILEVENHIYIKEQEKANQKASYIRSERQMIIKGYIIKPKVEIMIIEETPLNFGEALEKKMQEYDPGEYIGQYKITTYYTPVRDQKHYPFASSYEEAFNMNCSGNCRITASGHYLELSDAFHALACPPGFKFGDKLRLETSQGITEATCWDRGGAIKGRRLDLWVGVGDDAWVGRYSGMAKVYRIK